MYQVLSSTIKHYQALLSIPTLAQLRRIVRVEDLTIGIAGSLLGVTIGVAMMSVSLSGAIPVGVQLQLPQAAIIAGLLAGPFVA